MTQVPPAREHLRAAKRLEQWKHEHAEPEAIAATGSSPEVGVAGSMAPGDRCRDGGRPP